MRRHGALTVCVAFLAFRVLDLIGFWVLAAANGETLRQTLLSWDGGWLTSAATDGWPSHLEFDADGTVPQTTWAWPPFVPLAARWGAAMVGSDDVGTALVAINLLGGVLAAVLLFATLRDSLGSDRAVGVAVVWSALAATPVFLMGYADGVFAALVFGSLLLMTRHRYVLAGLVLVPAGLTKAAVVPFAATLLIAVVMRRRTAGSSALPAPAAVGAVGLAMISVLAWPAWAAVQLHSWDAYALTQSAWGRSSLPFSDTWMWLVNAVREPTLTSWFGIAAVVLAVVSAVAVARDSRFPYAFRVNAVAVPVFMLVVGASISTARLLLPDSAIAAFLQRWFSRPLTVISLAVALLLVRLAWIAIFVGGSAGAPAP